MTGVAAITKEQAESARARLRGLDLEDLWAEQHRADMLRALYVNPSDPAVARRASQMDFRRDPGEHTAPPWLRGV